MSSWSGLRLVRFRYAGPNGATSPAEASLRHGRRSLVLFAFAACPQDSGERVRSVGKDFGCVPAERGRNLFEAALQDATFRGSRQLTGCRREPRDEPFDQYRLSTGNLD
jgi:hypothetical protein